MLGDTFIFTLPGKVPFWQKCQNDVESFHVNLTNGLLDPDQNLMKFSQFVYIIEK